MPIIKRRIKFVDDNLCKKENISELSEESDEELISKKVLKCFKSELGLDCNVLGREEEYEEIGQFIRGRVKDKTSGIILISGSPGTGKTFIVERILNVLEQKKTNELGFTLPHNYKIIRTNAPKIISSLNGSKCQINVAIFLHLLDLMKVQRSSVEKLSLICKKEGFKESIKYFIEQISRRKKRYIVLIDEIDLIKRGRRNYDSIFELFKAIIENPQSGLILTAISNNVQIGNEIIRLGIDAKKEPRVKLMVFSPYDYNILRDIVMQRVGNALESKDVLCINKAGVELCVRKVASVYGDCRRTLDACYLTIGKYITKQIGKSESDELDNIDVLPEENSSTISTRENSPILQRSPENDFNVIPLRKRARSMPLSAMVPIGEFQDVISNIHHSNKSRVEIISSLPLHQQYVVMAIILVMIDEYLNIQEKKHSLQNISHIEFSFDNLTNNRVSSTLIKSKYNSICSEFFSIPEDFKEILDSLESINVISTRSDFAALRRSSSFSRKSKQMITNNETYVDLLFTPKQIASTLTTLPKLGAVFSSMLPGIITEITPVESKI
ncbi:ORC CDC6 like AAA ATpase [Cryptosporidium xiaoi]|uniref:ORC CDC6 like AAA ATpase n=1 Tax=Cryptosporidium xiaoi TaxID=659607 RepID=A0AAV9Y0I5_9CRYT